MTIPAGSDRVGGQRGPTAPSPPRSATAAGARPPGRAPSGFRPPGPGLPGFRPPEFRLPGSRLPGSRLPGSRLPGLRRPGSGPAGPGPQPWFEPDLPAPAQGMREAGPPAPVLAAFRWWLLAVALGLVAVGVSILLAVRYGDRYGSAAAGGATVGSVLSEVLILTVTMFVVCRMRAGDDWARIVLAVLGVLVGLLVAVTAITRFSTDTSMLAAFRSVTSTVRLLQVSAVGVAIWWMFHPEAGDWFEPRRRHG